MPATPSILGSAARDAAEIAAELRREFDVALQERYGTQAQPDPVLATLFHTFATQIGRLYREAEYAFPLGVLDDLLAGLGMAPRLAQPAQAVVALTGITRRERLTLDTGFIGTARSGERFTFVPDDSIELAPSELRFAAVYQDGRLTSVSGARPVKGGAFSLASTAALPLGASAPPAIWIAVDADAAHLSGLGVMLDTLPLGGPVARSLELSPWHVLDQNGTVTESGTLRARRGRGGVRRLQWLDETLAAADDDPVARVVDLAAGPYGEQVFIFPPVPDDRRWRTGVPRVIAPALPSLLPPDQAKGLTQPLVWLYVPLAPGTPAVASSLQRIALNAVTVSNMEVVAEQLPFDRMGSVVTLEPEGRKGRFLMGVLSVTGERGTAYAPDAALDAPLGAGRWRYRDRRLDLRPAQDAAGRLDTYAMVRLLYCDGESANGIDPGGIRQIGSPLGNVTAKVSNLVPSRAGSAPPEYPPAKLRFAELVRTRERVVTAADAEIAVRAFEPRVTRVSVTPVTSLEGGRARQGQLVSASVTAADFADPEAELPRLEAQLERHLRERAVLGFDVTVQVRADG
jgi:hypothetical protein